MEIRKNLRLAYRIEEKPGGGYIARSDDPGMEPIEAETKSELFRKVRSKAVVLIGDEIPLDWEPLQRGATVVDIATKQRRESPYLAANQPPRLAEQSSSGINFWKLMFFLLLAAVVGWILRHGL